MRSSDADILFIPGFGSAGADNWQARWAAKLSTARRVGLDGSAVADLAHWTQAISESVEQAARPVICIAHSLGAVALAHAAPLLGADKVRGAFLVAPMLDAAILGTPDIDRAFAPAPRAALAFPSLLVASRSDPQAEFAAAEDLALAWGARLVDAGDAGGIDAASGHGPWPEGLMSFAGFLKGL